MADHRPPLPVASNENRGLRPVRLDARDPVFRETPHPCLDALRASDPVHQDREDDRVVLTRADDVAAVLADRGLSANPFTARPTAYGRNGFTEEARDQRSMLFRDDPDHARLRRLVTQAFTARSVEALRPRVQAIATDLLDGIDPREPFDLIEAYAIPLPTLVIAAMLGIEDAEVAQFKQWSDDLAVVVGPERSQEDRARFDAAQAGLNACFARVIAERRARPRDDVIGRLVAAEAAGDRLTGPEILLTCRLLMVAGNITTTDLMGNGVVALLRHPEQLAMLRGAPERWPAAVEEMLRFDPPVAAWNRQAPQARRIGGCPVEAGQTVTAILLAANRDPALHAEPHRFDIGRANQKHHSFGGGAHFCLGASLARLEAQVGLAALFGRFPDLRLAPERPLRRKPHPPLNGYESIWLGVA